MDLFKLKSFYTVAELGSFSKAAKKLYLTQPAVSTQIKDLEYVYKTKLFDRVGRKINLTHAGETLMGFVEKILETYEESHFAINLLKDAREGSIKLSVSVLPGTRLLPKLLSSFRESYPDITFSIDILKSAAIVEALKQNKYDLGLLVSSDEHTQRLELVEQVIYRDHIVVGVSPNHILAQKNSISIRELSGLPIIVSLKNTVSRQALDRFFNHHSIPFTIAYEIDSKSMMKTMVEKNLGISFFSTLEIQAEIDLGWIHSLEIEEVPLFRNIKAVYHRDHELSPSAKAFYQFMINPENNAHFPENKQK